MAPAKKTKATTNGTKKTETKPVEKKVTKAAATKATETKTEAKKPAGKKLAPKKTNKIAELPTPPTKKPNAKTKATKATEDKKEAPAKKPVKKAAAAAKPAQKAAAKPAKKAAAKPTKKAASKKQEDDIEAALANEVDSSQDEDSSDEETEEKDFGDLESLIPFDKTYRSALTKLETQIKQGKDTRLGVVYVGRIPHKIQEKDLKIYFGQFGTIAHTRIARNPLTGRSRHYAFIQYKSQEVADIVVETMDNHLFGGRLLKVKSVPKDKVHPMLFTGERTKVSEEHNRKRTQSKITKQKDAKLTPYVKKRIESEMEKTQKAIKESGINYEVPKKLLTKKTDKPMIETKKLKLRLIKSRERLLK